MGKADSGLCNKMTPQRHKFRSLLKFMSSFFVYLKGISLFCSRNEEEYLCILALAWLGIGIIASYDGRYPMHYQINSIE